MRRDDPPPLAMPVPLAAPEMFRRGEIFLTPPPLPVKLMTLPAAGGRPMALTAIPGRSFKKN